MCNLTFHHCIFLGLKEINRERERVREKEGRGEEGREEKGREGRGGIKKRKERIRDYLLELGRDNYKIWIQELAPQESGFRLWSLGSFVCRSHYSHCLHPYEETLNSFQGAAHPQGQEWSLIRDSESFLSAEFYQMMTDESPSMFAHITTKMYSKIYL